MRPTGASAADWIRVVFVYIGFMCDCIPDIRFKPLHLQKNRLKRLLWLLNPKLKSCGMWWSPTQATRLNSNSGNRSNGGKLARVGDWSGVRYIWTNNRMTLNDFSVSKPASPFVKQFEADKSTQTARFCAKNTSWFQGRALPGCILAWVFVLLLSLHQIHCTTVSKNVRTIYNSAFSSAILLWIRPLLPNFSPPPLRRYRSKSLIAFLYFFCPSYNRAR